MASKLKKLKEIRSLVGGLKQSGKKIVFTNGCFDILHYGHVKYLEKCKRLGDILIVGLNSDSSVRKIKGKGRPVTGEKERAALLSALAAVDYIAIFSEPTPAILIDTITPDILVKGGDWKGRNIAGSVHVESHGGTVTCVPFVKGYSTTRILKRIKRRAF